MINAIDEIKLTLLRNALTPIGANKTANQSADTKQVSNDVIIPKQINNIALNAFGLISIENKLHSDSNYVHPSNSNNTTFIDSKNLVAITTRQNPLLDAFKVSILKINRAPNKQKITQMDNSESPKIFKSSSTQTEYTSNKEKGLEPLDPTKHSGLFTAHNDLSTPLYRQNLTKVFTEQFIAEASQKELKVIIDYVNTDNWEDLKK